MPVNPFDSIFGGGDSSLDTEYGAPEESDNPFDSVFDSAPERHVRTPVIKRPTGLPPTPANFPSKLRFSGDGTAPPVPAEYESIAQPGGKGQTLKGFEAKPAPARLVQPPKPSQELANLQAKAEWTKRRVNDPFRALVGDALVNTGKGLNEFFGFLNGNGIPTEPVMAPARRANEQQHALTPAKQARMKQDAVKMAGAELFDMVPNIPLGIAQEMMGIDPKKRIKSNVAGFVNKFLIDRDLQAEAPDALNQYKTAAGLLAPIPNLSAAGMAAKILPKAAGLQKAATAVKAGKPLAQMADSAVVGAGLGGGSAINSALLQDRHIDPAEVAFGTGAGAALGGGLAGMMHAPGALKGLFKGKQPPAQGTDLAQVVDEFAGGMPPDTYQDIVDVDILPDVQPGQIPQRDTAGLIEQQQFAGMIPKAQFEVKGEVLPMPMEELVAPPAQAIQRPTIPRIELPPDVMKGTPKYQTWQPNFQGDDLSKALYAVSNASKKNPQERVKIWVREVTGWSDEQIAAAAAKVNQAVQGAPKTSAAEFNVPTGTHGYKPRVRIGSEYGKQFLQEPGAGSSNPFDELFEPRVTPAEPAATTSGARSPHEQSAFDGTLAPAQTLDAPPTQLADDSSVAWRYQRKGLGHNKVDDYPELEGHPHLDTPEMRVAAGELSRLQLQHKYDAKVLDDYVERMFAQESFKPLIRQGDAPGHLVLEHNGVKVHKRQDEENFSGWERDELDKLRSDEVLRMAMSGELDAKTIGRTVETTPGSRFSDQPTSFQRQFEAAPIPQNIDDAIRQLVSLKDRVQGSKARNVYGSKQAYRDAVRTHRPLFESTEQRMREQTGDPLAQMAFKTKAKSPLGEEMDVGIAYRNETTRIKLDEQGAAILEAKKDALRSSNRNRQTKFNYSVDAKLLKRAALATMGGVALSLDEEAEAAGKGKSHANPGMAALKLAAIAGITAVVAPRAAKHLLTKSNSRMVAAFKDTMDQVQYLDNELGSDLARQVWIHSGGVLRASFGVKFENKAQLQQIKDALRKGTLEPDDVLKGTPGTLAEHLKPDQKKALYTYVMAQDNLARLANQQLQAVDQHIEHLVGLGKNTNLAVSARHALQSLSDALSPKGRADDPVSNAYGKLLSNFYDSQFFWNPVFHGTNLTDSFVAGGSRVGPQNMARAHNLLGVIPGLLDKELKTLFTGSNFVGGFEFERAAQNAATKRMSLLDKDIPSDKINANRVALGALLQFAQTRGKINGWKGRDIDFAKEFMRGGGRLDPTMAMDAQVHLAETLSRTLGVDPFRLNTDWLSRQPGAPYYSTFVKQPARVSRLALNYLTEGNVKGLLTMLGYTALFAGPAVIPEDGKYIWKNGDPESYFLAASILERLELYSAVTGNDLSPKLQWSVVAPLMASPLLPVDVLAHTAQDISHGKVKGQDKALSTTGSILSLFAPRIKGVPTGELLRLLKAGNQAAGGEIPVSFYDSLPLVEWIPGVQSRRYASKEEVPFKRAGTNPAMHFLDEALIPGVSSTAAKLQSQKLEADQRENAFSTFVFGNQKVKPKDQFFKTPKAPQPVQDDLMHGLFGR